MKSRLILAASRYRFGLPTQHDRKLLVDYSIKKGYKNIPETIDNLLGRK